MTSLLLLLVLVVVSLSISASDARYDLTAHANSTSFSQHSRKDMAKARVDVITSSVKMTPSSKEFAALERLNGLREAQVKDARRETVLSGAAPIPSRVRSSSRVPRRGGRENPGFDVDYIGPRTHPPSHN